MPIRSRSAIGLTISRSRITVQFSGRWMQSNDPIVEINFWKGLTTRSLTKWVHVRSKIDKAPSGPETEAAESQRSRSSTSSFANGEKSKTKSKEGTPTPEIQSLKKSDSRNSVPEIGFWFEKSRISNCRNPILNTSSWNSVAEILLELRSLGFLNELYLKVTRSVRRKKFGWPSISIVTPACRPHYDRLLPAALKLTKTKLSSSTTRKKGVVRLGKLSSVRRRFTNQDRIAQWIYLGRPSLTARHRILVW